MYSIKDVSGKIIAASHGQLLVDALVGAGMMTNEFPCGRRGVCRKCQVRMKSGNQWLEVLSCQTLIESDLEVDVSPSDQSMDVCLTEGLGRRAPLAPAIRKTQFIPPSDDPAPTWEDVCRMSGIPSGQGMASNEDVLKMAVTFCKKRAPFTIVTRFHEVMTVESGDTRDQLYGMAFDIGTTTVAGYLVDLNKGSTLATVSTLNPQVQYGADVISRITFADSSPDGLDLLRTSIVRAVNDLIGEAARKAGINRESIYDLIFVGNPCMHHLFLGIDPGQLGRAPYQPFIRTSVSLNAYSAGLDINKSAIMSWLPIVAGFVGADTVSMLLAHPLEEEAGVTLAVDIGTNGEVVLASRGALWACSAAAGPAFEGYSMKSGIRAQNGAIDSVWIDTNGVSYHVIGEGKPQGICGSGLVDAVSGLLTTGHLDRSGRLSSSENVDPISERIVERDGLLVFLLATREETRDGREVVITQKDIRHLQLAKAAIAAGIKILLAEAGLQWNDVEKVILAGAFGLYLKPESIKTIKLLGEIPSDRIRAVGNAAGMGAQNALLSVEDRENAAELVNKINYVELAGRADFVDLFMKELSF